MKVGACSNNCAKRSRSAVMRRSVRICWVVSVQMTSTPPTPCGADGFIDGSVAVGPVDLLQRAVTNDRHELVFVPGRGVTAHHLVDLRADDVPDFRPGLLGGHAEDRRMFLRTQRAAVRIVVEAGEFRTPEDEHRDAAW